jgi:RND family efflux transporter MFP subunit
LRLDFPVSVAYINDIHVGDQVDVRVESLAGKTFSGVISRTAQKVDEGTRTMLTEVEVVNPNLELVPGMYAEALLKVQRRPHALAIPIESVSQQKPATVYVVNQAGQIEVHPVSLGIETASNYEVLKGLKDGDLVMIGARSSVKAGQQVEAKLVSPSPQE